MAGSPDAHLQAGADESFEWCAGWPFQRRGRHSARDDEQRSHRVQVRVRRLPDCQLQGDGQSLIAAGLELTTPTAQCCCWSHRAVTVLLSMATADANAVRSRVRLTVSRSALQHGMFATERPFKDTQRPVIHIVALRAAPLWR